MTVSSLVHTISPDSLFADTSEFCCPDYSVYSKVTVLMKTSASSTGWKQVFVWDISFCIEIIQA